MNELKNYTIIKKLGSGAFGTVYKAKNNKENKIVAIKVEDKEKTSRLEYEGKIHKDLDNIVGFPRFYGIIKTKKQTISIMDYLGPSLEDLFEFCGNKLTSIVFSGFQ